MDTESRYLRDIRDAIKGIAKRSGMDVSGNAKTKYLKEIADAIRENGGGGHDGNDKVKQEVVSSSDTAVRLLFGDATNETVTTSVKKSTGNLSYNANNNTLTFTSLNTQGTQSRFSAGGCTAEATVHSTHIETQYKANDAVMYNQTWDGTNSSLKAALAAAKEGNFFIANFSLVSTGDYLYPMFLQETGYTISSTGPSVNYGTQNEFYLDKSYEEILAAIQAGKIPLILSPAKQIWVLYSTPSQSEDAMVFEDIKNHAFYFDDNNNELSITTSKITIMPSPSPTNG